MPEFLIGLSIINFNSFFKNFIPASPPTTSSFNFVLREFITLSGTYDSALVGVEVSLGAIEDCASDGDLACDSDDTRMVLSDTGAQALESAFISGLGSMALLERSHTLFLNASASNGRNFNASGKIN